MEILLDVLALQGAPRDAARSLTSRHDADPLAAATLQETFTTLGVAVIAAAEQVPRCFKLEVPIP